MPKLIQEPDGRFVFISTYEERHIPKKARFEWDPVSRRWYTYDEEKARYLSIYAEGALRETLEKGKAVDEKMYFLSNARSSDIDVPHPEGRDYYPFQKAGIEYILENFKLGRNTLLADDMGLGKTTQVIGVINKLKLKKVLIICPVSMMLSWRQELLGSDRLPGWLIQYDIRKAMGLNPMTEDDMRDALIRLGFKKPTKDLIEEFKKSLRCGWRVHISKYKSRMIFDPDANINIINYDVLADAEEELKNYPFDLICIDEAHYLKNMKTKRASSAFNICSGKRLILITGTPILNRPSELYSLLFILDPKYWGPFNGDMYWWFMKTFAGAFKTWNPYIHADVWDMSGATNLEELQVILRKRHMVRRKKADVIYQLPRKTRQLMIIDPNTQEMKDALESEKKMLMSQGLSIDEILQKLGDSFDMGVDKLKQGFSNVRKDVAMAKLPTLLKFTDDLLDNTNKIVIFAWHRDVVDEICKHYGPIAVKYYGGMSIDEKNEAQNKFMSDPDIKVFVGNIKSAGFGLTLTASHTVVFAEIDWVPAMMQQAEDRCHRITQMDNVQVYYTVVDGSIEAVIASTIVEKLNIIEKAVDVTENTPSIHEIVKKEEEELREMEEQARMERRNSIISKRNAEIEAYIQKKGGESAFAPEDVKHARAYTPEKEIALIDAIKFIHDNNLASPGDLKYVNAFSSLRYLSGGQYVTSLRIVRNYPIPDELRKIIYDI